MVQTSVLGMALPPLRSRASPLAKVMRWHDLLDHYPLVTGTI